MFLVMGERKRESGCWVATGVLIKGAWQVLPAHSKSSILAGVLPASPPNRQWFSSGNSSGQGAAANPAKIALLLTPFTQLTEQ